jgi:signal recognition particle GTPase
MMDEIARVHKSNQPQETLFVGWHDDRSRCDTAKAFNDILNFDGVILTN